MKLIVDISDDLYNVIKSDKYGLHKGKMYDIIRNGTPLDSVKKEIETDLSWNMYDDYGNETSLHKALMKILYNIDDEIDESEE